MRKIFTTLFLTAASFGLTASAQELPEKIDGFYRMTNSAFQEALTARHQYDLGATLPNPTNAGSVFRVETAKMYSFADEMTKLEEQLQAGEITEEQYFALFMNLMNITSWKSGFFPVAKFEAQGFD